MGEYDLVIRSGSVVDGTGSPSQVADVAVLNGIVVKVGSVKGCGEREIDAAGAVVAPGFVDIHTHYDGQAVWDNRLEPSSWHGVTTVVAGNCGVGFAPVVTAHRERLLELMEGVEEIPGTALHEGLSWDWTSFGDFLDVLERRPRDVDLATQVPHAALRFFAMGDRAVAHEQATESEVALMARLARDAVEAGAIGFSTSRTLTHKSKAGGLTPVYGTDAHELVAISAAVGSVGSGVLQLITDFPDLDEDFALMRRMVRASGWPLMITVVQLRDRPDHYREVLKRVSLANAEGFPIKAQVASRYVGITMGLQCLVNPFMTNQVWRTLADLPHHEQARRMADPEMRAAILAAQTTRTDPNIGASAQIALFDNMYEIGETPDYEPSPEQTLAARAARTGRTPPDLAYDILISDDGRGMICQPFANYAHGSLDAVREMLVHEHSIPGLGDAGAHVATICDASFPTTLLQYWVRDRPRDRLDLPFVVKRQANDTAQAFGLSDRGQLRPGYKADVNVIDLDALKLHSPRMSYDLPGGGGRLLQRVEGYRHTFVSGVETYRNGESTGALPGRVVRGTRPRPSVAPMLGRTT